MFGIIFNFYINSNSSINKALKVDTNIVENIIDEDIEVVEVDLLQKYLDFEPSSDVNEGVVKQINLSPIYKLKKFQICCYEYSFYEKMGEKYWLP